MKVFTVWTENEITGKYKQCLKKLSKAYPQLETRRVNGIIKNEHPGSLTDKERFRILGFEYEGQDVLYIDSDCIPNEIISSSSFDRSAFALVNTTLDYWAIFKKAKDSAIFQDIYYSIDWDNKDNISQQIHDIINRRYIDCFDSIEGSPSNKYFEHFYHSTIGRKI